MLRVLLEQIPTGHGYQGIPGLHRKYFLGNEMHGGGVYEWESRAAAEAFYNRIWRERLRTVYGAVPEVEFFELHAVVDNDARTARIDA